MLLWLHLPGMIFPWKLLLWERSLSFSWSRDRCPTTLHPGKASITPGEVSPWLSLPLLFVEAWLRNPRGDPTTPHDFTSLLTGKAATPESKLLHSQKGAETRSKISPHTPSPVSFSPIYYSFSVLSPAGIKKKKRKKAAPTKPPDTIISQTPLTLCYRSKCNLD